MKFVIEVGMMVAIAWAAIELFFWIVGPRPK